MPGFDPNTWYILTTLLQSSNNTLTAGPDTQTAFDPNSPSAVYLAPTEPDSSSQQWQLLLVNASSASAPASAYVLRNRQLGAAAYLTTAWTTRKCGGGNCATVPVLSPQLTAETLWEFGSWGFSDATGAAFVYNLGNGSSWRLNVMDGEGVQPELSDNLDPGRAGAHWNATAVATFAGGDSGVFGATPTGAAALLARVAGASQVSGTGTGAGATITPYTVSGGSGGGGQTATATATGTAGNGDTTSDGGSSQSHSGLSTSASIGIGVGIAVAVFLILAVAGFFVFRCYRRRRAATGPGSVAVEKGGNGSPALNAVPVELTMESKQPVTTGAAELGGSDYSDSLQFQPHARAEIGRGVMRHELHS